ncbi:GIY-YIG nuclease family protein [Pseudoalteromonas rubra]|uniref:GIY-YIG nuclease family protein n=1 Tax=Pseudoalteromonas rubra TaxID=43658 RepID=UPI00197E9CE1|nr:GIY-YIG nuclease family protein [Pseudoalteromonas rubra]
MAFKEKRDCNLQGMDWCFYATEQNRAILQAKYRKGQSIRAKAQKNRPDRGNVYADGNALIGFLCEEDFSWVCVQREQGNKIYGQIHKVECLEDFPKHVVIVRLQTSPFKKLSKASSVSSGASISNPVLIRKPRSASIKHPITQKAFRAQKDLSSVCRNLSGRTGIYCIYAKSFATYIGQSKDIGSRMRKHIADLRADRHHNSLLQSDWNQYGESYFAFHQVELCTDSELDKREHFYICAFKTFEYGYNATENGQPPVMLVDQEITTSEEVSGANKEVIENKSESNFALQEDGPCAEKRENTSTIAEILLERLEGPGSLFAASSDVQQDQNGTHTGRKNVATTQVQLSATSRKTQGASFFSESKKEADSSTPVADRASVREFGIEVSPGLYADLETSVSELYSEFHSFRLKLSVCIERYFKRPSKRRLNLLKRLNKLELRISLNKRHLTKGQFLTLNERLTKIEVEQA